METAPTTHVRLTESDWNEVKAALQYAAAMRQAVSPALLNRFVGRKFEPSPKVIGEATDLIGLFVAARCAPGPVTVSITGPQGSGKTVLTRALAHALRVVKVPVHVVGDEPFDDQTPTYVIHDGPVFDPAPVVAVRRSPDEPVEIVYTMPDPVHRRVRRYLGRLVGRIREALSR